MWKNIIYCTQSSESILEELCTVLEEEEICGIPIEELDLLRLTVSYQTMHCAFIQGSFSPVPCFPCLAPQNGKLGKVGVESKVTDGGPGRAIASVQAEEAAGLERRSACGHPHLVPILCQLLQVNCFSEAWEQEAVAGQRGRRSRPCPQQLGYS